VVSSPPFPLPGGASLPADVAIPPPYYTSFTWSQNEIDASASSSGNASSRCLHSWVETQAFNPDQRRQPLSPYRPSLTLHCNKNVISNLATLPTTQPRIHFTFSLARAARHWRSTCCRRFLSPLSHAHHPYTQQHSRWWTSGPSFDSRTYYRHVNSRQNIF
jgi:hypothetical protein